ncbi:MAG: FAD-dependent oxidoreductase [Phycisphaerales bacterium]|nr:FAD-dependent oxidoreductase [Phycisphaerales bacterium]
MSRSLYARLHRRFGPPQDALTRREMIRQTLAAAAGLALAGPLVGGCAGPGRAERFEPLPPDRVRRIIVIGAGVAGLAAADRLHRMGHDVTVLEARARVGGRVLSMPDMIAGKVVEGGGEFIGSNHPAWLSFAERFGLELIDVADEEGRDAPILLNGRLLGAGEAEALYREMSQATESLTQMAYPIDASLPWLSPGAAELDRRSVADWLAEEPMGDVCRAALTAEFGNNAGVPCERQSLLGVLAMIKGGGLNRFWTESENHRCKGGAQQLAEKLAGAVGAGRIRLSTPVTAVEAGDAGVRVTVRREAGGGDERLEGDGLVLAVPPAVWGKIAFSPGLPAALAGADAPQCGDVIKYIASVKGRFWERAHLSPSALTDELVGLTWHATQGQRGGGEEALTMFSGGAAAARARAISAGERDAAYRAAVERLLPGYGEAFAASRFMDWPGEAWTGTGYSFPAPGQVMRAGPLLAGGFGRVRFAGEHASSAFVGYMEGALNSGVRAALTLVEVK